MTTPPPVPPDDVPGIPPVPIPQAAAGSDGGQIPPVPGSSVFPPASMPPMPHAPPPVYAGQPPVIMPQPKPGNSTKVLLFGCLGLVVVAVVGTGIGVTWLYGKAKEIVANPEKFVAEMVVKENPDLELLNIDRGTRQVTLRSKSSGETVSLSLDDVEAGKIILRKSDGSVAEIGPGGLKVTDKDGSTTVAGGAAAAPLPDWLPPYPGPHQTVVSSRQDKDGLEKGTLSFTTADSLPAAAGAWRKTLEDAGFTVTVENLPGVEGQTLQAEAALSEGRAMVTARIISQSGQTLGHVEYARE